MHLPFPPKGNIFFFLFYRYILIFTLFFLSNQNCQNISNRFWTRSTLLLAAGNEQCTYCQSKMPETSWQNYVTFILCLSVIFLWHCTTFGLQKDCIRALYAKDFLCIFKTGSSGSFAFAGSGLRNTITRFSDCSKTGETNMNIYRYSEAICIVQILLLYKSNVSFIAFFNGSSVTPFAVLLLTIWCLKTSFHSWVNIEQKKTMKMRCWKSPL